MSGQKPKNKLSYVSSTTSKPEDNGDKIKATTSANTSKTVMKPQTVSTNKKPDANGITNSDKNGLDSNISFISLQKTSMEEKTENGEKKPGT